MDWHSVFILESLFQSLGVSLSKFIGKRVTFDSVLFLKVQPPCREGKITKQAG